MLCLHMIFSYYSIEHTKMQDVLQNPYKKWHNSIKQVDYSHLQSVNWYVIIWAMKTE